MTKTSKNFDEENNTIVSVSGAEVLDSRGFPTVEVELVLKDASSNTYQSRAIVPSGASTGENEALELRDGDASRYHGKGVLTAVKNVNDLLGSKLKGQKFDSLRALDDCLLDLDGTPTKSRLGANALLGISMAYVRAAAQAAGVDDYEYIAGVFDSEGVTVPTPMMNIINGGKHADNTLDVQEFMIIPAGFETFSESLRAGSEIFHHLKKILAKKGVSTGVGDEGGFAPDFPSNTPHEQALESMIEAIEKAGYEPGKQVFLALDAAASEFCKDGLYQVEGKSLKSNELIELYQKWIEKFPIISVEDGLSEHDWAGFEEMTRRLGSGCQLVGDDLFVTNTKFLQRGIDEKAANSILIKVNQIGTITETLKTIRLAKDNGFNNVVSHRSGETEDVFIADLAVGTDAGQIKTGSLCRTDRIAKYNQLLRIEKRLGNRARFAGIEPFRH